MTSTPQKKGFIEFIALMALMMSLPALSIDAMLPALPMIGGDLGVADPNNLQFVVSTLFMGMAIGQLIYGPLSDSRGRKPAIYLAIAIFIFGSLLSVFATNYIVMLVGRFFQGLGAAGPRIVSVALVRDEYEGRAMARVMSFIMTVFILVPVVAPALGQLVLFVASWREIFSVLLFLSLTILFWFSLRQVETLPIDKRIPLSCERIIIELHEIFSYKSCVAYGITSGLVFGAMVAYLSSIQPILQDLYGVGNKFALYFSIIATAIGIASMFNARLVMRYGMHLLSRIAIVTFTIASFIFIGVVSYYNGLPTLWMFLAYLLSTFFCIGVLFGNLNAISMEPLGHIAGMGAAVMGSLSTFIAIPIGIFIGRCYNETVMPLVIGFFVLGVIALAITIMADKD